MKMNIITLEDEFIEETLIDVATPETTLIIKGYVDIRHDSIQGKIKITRDSTLILVNVELDNVIIEVDTEGGEKLELDNVIIRGDTKIDMNFTYVEFTRTDTNLLIGKDKLNNIDFLTIRDTTVNGILHGHDTLSLKLIKVTSPTNNLGDYIAGELHSLDVISTLLYKGETIAEYCLFQYIEELELTISNNTDSLTVSKVISFIVPADTSKLTELTLDNVIDMHGFVRDW